MKELYLSRHGQTLFNDMNLFQGHVDAPLTKLGISQAQRSNRYLKENNLKFDYYACSTLERTEQTLENIVGNEDIEHERFKGLKEVFFGDLEGQTFLIPEMKEGVSSLSVDDFFKENHVESLEAATSRIVSVLEKIRNKDGNRALVVSHGLIISYFLTYNLNKPFSEIERMDNCDIAVFENDGNSWKFIKVIKNKEM